MSLNNFTYNYSVKRYQNSADGVRYNVSFSRPQTRKRNYYSDLFHHAIVMKSVFPAPRPGKISRKCGKTYILKRFGKLITDYQRDRSNVLRAIREIRNIGLANDWNYFVTFTLDPKKHDRTDYQTAAKKMTQYFRNLRKKGYDIEYLLIPEAHKKMIKIEDKETGELIDYDSDDALHTYHFHGLIRGNIDSLLTPHPLQWQREKGYLDFPEFASRFGYVSLSPVSHTNFVVYYCLKYINKQFQRTKWNEGVHMYYVSRNIARPQEVRNFSGVEIPAEYLASNFHFTDYNSAYFRGLTQDQVFESEMQFLFENCYYSQQETVKEIFA